jgi:arylsulfatase A-like enzyme
MASRFDKLPDDHFSSEAYTDFIIKSNEEHKADGKPFFAYLSFQAVHSPFAAPDDWLDKYKGVYDKGYDAIRAERLERMKELGIVSKDTVLSPRVPSVPAWDTLTPEQKKLSARRMEVYAAMLANMDHHIGRLIDHLKQTGQYENTLVVFLSDNGAEPVELGTLVETVFNEDAKKWFFEKFDNTPRELGPQRFRDRLRRRMGAGRLNTVAILQSLDRRGRHPFARGHRGSWCEKRGSHQNRRHARDRSRAHVPRTRRREASVRNRSETRSPAR